MQILGQISVQINTQAIKPAQQSIQQANGNSVVVRSPGQDSIVH